MAEFSGVGVCMRGYLRHSQNRGLDLNIGIWGEGATNIKSRIGGARGSVFLFYKCSAKARGYWKFNTRGNRPGRRARPKPLASIQGFRSGNTNRFWLIYLLWFIWNGVLGFWVEKESEAIVRLSEKQTHHQMAIMDTAAEVMWARQRARAKTETQWLSGNQEEWLKCIKSEEVKQKVPPNTARGIAVTHFAALCEAPNTEVSVQRILKFQHPLAYLISPVSETNENLVSLTPF